ncbi:MAG: cobalamin B12-binding domain-containing protein [Gemmatimonadaceae bacterium]
MPKLSSPILSTAPRYPIRVVARRVGITELTLRAWERRYAAVEPARSEGRQRLFSEADIERLMLLRELTSSGTAISVLAPMTTVELRLMAPAVAAQALSAVREDERRPQLARDLVLCGRAIAALESDRLQQMLMRLVLERGPLPFLEDVASPLCGWIGDEWVAGRLSEAQEHVASEVLRRVFGFLLQTLRRERQERHVVLATLPGERHEFGAMMAGIIAAFDGWSYNYLGPGLPVLAIASAVKRLDARLVAVSIVAPQAGSHAARELVALRHAVDRRVDIVVGGPSSAIVDHVLDDARATRIGSLREWRELLAQRRGASKKVVQR